VNATLPEKLFIDTLETPIGTALVVTDEKGVLRAFDWSDHDARLRRLMGRYYGAKIPILDGAAPPALRTALQTYFGGDIHALEGLSWEAAGTPFQLSVWRALCDIPVGETISYAELARRVGRPKAVRAVGLANGANPVGLIAPCHRVIGANGTLTGYGGGLHRKRWLLRHEGAAWREDGAGLAAQPALL
jgi:methylated-DNA-[protein]-cysteine S-methyltransferase